MRPLKLVPLTLAAIACVFAAPQAASASSSAMKIAYVKALYATDTTSAVAAKIRAYPDVASVETFIASDTAHVTSAMLEPYDAIIVSGNNNEWTDPAELGDAIADAVERGVPVVTGIYTAWLISDPRYALRGRFLARGLQPFALTQIGTNSASTIDQSSTIGTIFEDLPPTPDLWTYGTEVGEGATLLATWDSGQPAIAVKGRVLAYNGWIGDQSDMHDIGVAEMVMKAFRALGRHDATVTRTGNGAGTVSGPLGPFACTTACVGPLSSGMTSVLTAAPAAGSAFTGWGGACSGASTCSLAIGYPGLTAAGWATPTLSASFALTGLKSQKFKKGKLQLTLPGAGKLKIKASGVQTISKTVKAGTVKYKLKFTGSLKKKLKAGKSVKVKFKFAYTPTGAAAATNSTKTLKVKG